MAKLIGIPYSNVPLAVNSLVRKIREMNRLFGIPENLKKLNISRADVMKVKDQMTSAAMNDICTKTNPRAVTVDDLEKIIGKIAPM